MYIGDNIYRALQDWRGLPGTGNARSQSWSPVQYMNESRRMYEIHPVCVSTMYQLCINYVSTMCHELHARSRSSSPVQYMNESCVWMGQVWMSLSHVCINHVTHVNKSCHTFARVVSHIQTNHVTHTNESSLPIAITRMREMIRACATVRFNMCHQAFVHTRINKSCHTYEWVIVADRYHRYEWNDSSCHTYECDSTL